MSGVRPVRIGIDIGGTFTDLQISDARTGALHSLKTPTTPADPSLGLMAGLDAASTRFGFALDDIGFLLHGTTIATNAVLERKLPRGVLLTTAGFRDVLEIGRHARRDVYGLQPYRAAALIPRDRRVEVAERMRADGAAELPLTQTAIAAAITTLDQLEAETVAICLLHAHVNAAHERALQDAILAARPTLPVSISSEVSPEIREYERSSTTVLNALLIPVVRAYLDRLTARLAARGVGARLLLVQSNGGVCSVEMARAQPVRLLLSGPSGGALGAQRAAVRLGMPDLVGIDMGGTSFDVCVVRGGGVAQMTQGEIDGLPVRLPMVELRTIGAGGGSIAQVLEGGRLAVGPRSAGSLPGPVGYGRGGTQPTVTDANLTLGLLDPASFLGGAMALDTAGARLALEALGAKLDLHAQGAAEGVVRLTNATLASAIRLSLFEKGLDPRTFALLSFGGAGGLHAIPVADELGITSVVFPAGASTFSAGGILHSDIVHDLATAALLPAAPASLPALTQAAARLRAQGNARLDEDGIPPPARRLRLAADMRYRGQAFELLVPWPDPDPTSDPTTDLSENHSENPSSPPGLTRGSTVRPAAPPGTMDPRAKPADDKPSAISLQRLLAAFHALHAQRFSYANPDDPVEIVTLRLTAIGTLPRIAATPSAAAASAPPTDRRVFLHGAWRDIAVHRRQSLQAAITGPALIEEDYTTVFVGAFWRCAPGPGGDLIATRTQASADTAAHLGPVELEIIRNALTSAAAEMDVTIWRTSRSTIVRELLDYSTAVFDRDGFNIAQSARIPQHLNSMGAGLQTIVRDVLPLDQWEEGDVVVTNDPYCGGQHIPDLLAFRPVFAWGQRVAIVGTLCHHLDMGGISAGSYGATATEIFQEGLRIPPIKLFRRGALNAEVLAVMRQNVRRPDMLWGDLQAQLASLAVGQSNLQRLAARLGPATLRDACARLLDLSEAAMRAMIARMPDGRYEFEDWVDDDGLTDTPIRIHAAIEINGDRIEVDLTGSGPQALGPINATLASSGSAVSYAVMACADAPIPANAGCNRPVTVRARPGSIVHAQSPSPVANRIAVTHRLATTLLGALHQAVPARIPAAYYGASYVCSFNAGGHVLVEIEVGGTGGHPQSDGLNGFSFGMHNNANIPVEMIESETPMTITQYQILPDTGGAGRYRGGAGLVRAWRMECDGAVFTANLERFKFRPYGLAGGAPGSAGRLSLIRDGVSEPLPSKVGNRRLRRGDVIRLETSGGGGFGDPATRDPAATTADHRQGLVTGGSNPLPPAGKGQGEGGPTSAIPQRSARRNGSAA